MKIKNDDVVQIGELAESLGVTTRTIRYYEEIGLMSPPDRLEGGMRVYAKDDERRLKFILKLKDLGITLKEMQELADIYKTYKNPDKIMPKLLAIYDKHINKIDEKISNLSSLRQDIVKYRTQIQEVLAEQEQHS
jgi:MerR family transcriptional regulator, repressor of the yfmOP operon